MFAVRQTLKDRTQELGNITENKPIIAQSLTVLSLPLSSLFLSPSSFCSIQFASLYMNDSRDDVQQLLSIDKKHHRQRLLLFRQETDQYGRKDGK